MYRFVKKYCPNTVHKIVEELDLSNLQSIKIDKCFTNDDMETLHLIFTERPLSENEIREKLKNFLIFKRRVLDSIYVEIVRNVKIYKYICELHENEYKLFKD